MILWEYHGRYPLVNIQKRWKNSILISRSCVNGPFSIAMLVFHPQNHHRYVVDIIPSRFIVGSTILIWFEWEINEGSNVM
jgi:hypothetical protein